MIQFDLLRAGGAEVKGREDVVRDLELDKIINAVAQKDELIRDVWTRMLLMPETDVESIRYRQEAVRDAIRNRNVIVELYNFTRDVITRTRRATFLVTYDNPELVVFETAAGMRIMIDAFKDLKGILGRASFSSQAFRGLVDTLRENADDGFIASAKELLSIFDIRNDTTEFSVRLGAQNTLADPTLLVPKKEGGIIKKLFNKERAYEFRLDPHDERGAEILGDIRKWVLANIAPIMLNAYESLLRFYTTLSEQLAFFVGAINLHDLFQRLELPLAYPEFSEGTLSFGDLHCLSLAISLNRRPVPNSLETRNVSAFIITGVNRGGKTTFLKSVGQAILLARAGVFVPASRLVLPSAGAVHTHFQREEERTMSYGKFEEEVVRFSRIVDSLRPGDYVLMNESFSTTNQVEASEVARQVVQALVDSGVTVFYVTFLQDFIYRLIRDNGGRAILLVPERLKDGTRTFRLLQGSVQPGYALEIWDKLVRSGSSGGRSP
ncbi:MAG: hypothetical protein RXP86_05975 [Acidilobus sp.]